MLVKYYYFINIQTINLMFGPTDTLQFSSKLYYLLESIVS